MVPRYHRSVPFGSQAASSLRQVGDGGRVDQRVDVHRIGERRPSPASSRRPRGRPSVGAGTGRGRVAPTPSRRRWWRSRGRAPNCHGPPASPVARPASPVSTETAVCAASRFCRRTVHDGVERRRCRPPCRRSSGRGSARPSSRSRPRSRTHPTGSSRCRDRCRDRRARPARSTTVGRAGAAAAPAGETPGTTPRQQDERGEEYRPARRRMIQSH